MTVNVLLLQNSIVEIRRKNLLVTLKINIHKGDIRDYQVCKTVVILAIGVCIDELNRQFSIYRFFKVQLCIDGLLRWGMCSFKVTFV